MKNRLVPALSLIMMCLLGVSCIKDAPIYPDDPDFVPYAGTKGNASAETVNETFLGGKWRVSKMYNESYNNGVLVASFEPPITLFQGVELNNTTKGYLFDGSFDAPDPGTYTLTKVGSALYLQLTADPFKRSSNYKIQITNLTANSMTWVAIDPMITDTPVGKVQTGYKVVYIRP